MVKGGVGEFSGRGRIISSGVSAYFEESDGRVESSATTIDNLVSNFNFKNVGLIKMDIEGFELLAVKGAKETIKNSGLH